MTGFPLLPPTSGEPDTRPDWLKNFVPVPNKLADRRKSEQQVITVRAGNDAKFQPGVSGNPAGRPKGSKNRNSNQLKQRLLENVEGILDTMVAQALAGDAQAAALVVNRVLPTLRPQSQLVQFTLDADQPITKQVEQVLSAIAKGEVAADVGKKIMEAIATLAQVRAVEDLAKRIEALEDKKL